MPLTQTWDRLAHFSLVHFAVTTLLHSSSIIVLFFIILVQKSECPAPESTEDMRGLGKREVLGWQYDGNLEWNRCDEYHKKPVFMRNTLAVM